MNNTREKLIIKSKKRFYNKENHTKKRFRLPKAGILHVKKSIKKKGGAEISDSGLMKEIIETYIDNDITYKNVERRTKELINRGFDINLYIHVGLTPLLYACQIYCEKTNPNIKMLEILLENGADVNKRSLVTGDTPLLFCLNKNDCNNIENIIDLLIHYNVDLNLKELYGKKMTPLHIACYHDDYYDIVDKLLDEKLLDRRAKINATDIDNLTPLHIACMNHDYNIVKLLLDNGSDINANTKKKYTPLHYLCASFEYNIETSYNILNLFIQKGANINAIDDMGQTPLMVLFDNIDNINIQKNINGNRKFFFVELLKFFIKKGANINIKDKNYNNIFIIICISYAHEQCCYYLCKELFRHNINITKELLNEVLGYQEITYKLLSLLVKKGANINKFIINMLPTKYLVLSENIITENPKITPQFIIDLMINNRQIKRNILDIPETFNEELPFIEELKKPVLDITLLYSEHDVLEGFDYISGYRDIDEFRNDEENINNSLIIYYGITHNKYKCGLINKRTQIIEGYIDRKNIFYICKDLNKAYNYKDNVYIDKPLYKMQVYELDVYVLLQDVLKMIKSTHEYWFLKKTDKQIDAVCSRSNLISNGNSHINYDGFQVNIMSGSHCQADKDADGNVLNPQYMYELIPVDRIEKTFKKEDKYNSKKRKSEFSDNHEDEEK